MIGPLFILAGVGAFGFVAGLLAGNLLARDGREFVPDRTPEDGLFRAEWAQIRKWFPHF